MQESSSSHQDQSIEPCAELNIFINDEGNLEYNCDWDSNEIGLTGIASILYSVMFGDLCPQILQEIRQQCVSNNTEADYLTIVDLISKYSQNLSDGRDDEVAVPPDQSYNI